MQARAKAELREEVTEKDAMDVVELMKWSMVDTFIDEFGALDFQRSTHGSGMSSKNQVSIWVELHCTRVNKALFDVEVVFEEAKLTCQIFVFFNLPYTEDTPSNRSCKNYTPFLVKKGQCLNQVLYEGRFKSKSH